MTREIDEQSGNETTGHDWDGIKELNNPVPIAFRVWLWGSIAVCIILWLLYPSFPSFSGYAKGLANKSSRVDVTQQVEDGLALRLQAMAQLTDTDITTLAEDPTLKAKYGDIANVVYVDNCAACHGRDLMGQLNFPNLTDAHWLWSGAPEEIEYTLQYGINHTSDDTRYAQMPAFGRDEMLERGDIKSVVEYVLQISGSVHDAALAKTGAVIFDDNCASCHEVAGVGGLGNGAPSLVDDAWIYGGSRDQLHATLKNGRAGVMPGWEGRLSKTEIKLMALYVLWAAQDDGQN